MDFNDIPVLVDDEEPDAKKPKLMETVDVLADFPSGLKISSIAIAANSAGLLESVSLSKKDSSWLVFRVKKPEEGASAGDCIDKYMCCLCGKQLSMTNSSCRVTDTFGNISDFAFF